jgi:outer membrane protein TolC
MLPYWGKRDLRRDVAAADVQQAAARTSAAWTELAMKIKTSYARYYLAAGDERLTREILDLMARVEQIAQARYAGGLVQQQDAIRAQLEQTTMRSELIMLESDKRQVRARLNALLARDAAAPMAEPRALRPLPAVGALEAPALAQRARANNPQLAAEAARLRGAEKNRELTRRNRYPDFTVGLSPTQMGSRITQWGVMVEVNIPLQQTTRRSQEAEAEAMVSAARSRSEALANQLVGDLGEQLAMLDAARSTEALVTNQSLPQSELSLRSAMAAYENGKLDFTALLEAQRQIRKTRQDNLKAQAEAQMRLAEIERIVGEDL